MLSALDYLIASSIVAALIICSTIVFLCARRGMGQWQYIAALLHVIGLIELGLLIYLFRNPTARPLGLDALIWSFHIPAMCSFQGRAAISAYQQSPGNRIRWGSLGVLTITQAVLGIVGFGYMLYKSMRTLDPAPIQPPSRILGAAAFIDVVSCMTTLYADDTNPSPWASSWGGLWREGKIHYLVKNVVFFYEIMRTIQIWGTSELKQIVIPTILLAPLATLFFLVPCGPISRESEDFEMRRRRELTENEGRQNSVSYTHVSAPAEIEPNNTETVTA